MHKDNTMRHTTSVVPLAGVFILCLLAGCQDPGRIEVANVGIDVIDVKDSDRAWTTQLGPNGTGFFNGDAMIQIGGAEISAGQRLKVVNAGSDIIQIAYRDTAGAERTMLLGEKGTGYFDQSTPIKIGDTTICVRNMP